MLFCGFYEGSKNTFSCRTPQVAAWYGHSFVFCDWTSIMSYVSSTFITRVLGIFTPFCWRVYVLLVDQVNVHSIHSLFYVFSNLLFLLKVDQVINRLIWSSIQLITKRFYDMLASMWHWSNCLKHMTQLDSYNYLENYVQNEAQLTNIILKTNLVILHIVPHLFHLKSEEDCITSLILIQTLILTFFYVHG